MPQLIFPTFAGIPLILILLLASCSGWGRLFRFAVLRSDDGSLDPSEEILTGLAVLTWLMAWVNYAWVFSPALAFAVICAGLVGFLPLFRPQMPKSPVSYRWPALYSAALVGIVLMWLYYPAVYNVFDDGPGYLTSPMKLLTFGGLGPEPFSERRILSLGGHYWLQACILSVSSVRYLSLVEPVLGMVLCILLVYSSSGRNQIPFWCSAPFLGIFVFWIAIGRKDMVNTAPAFLILPFLMALIRYARDGPSQKGEAIGSALPVQIGVIAAAAISFRPTSAIAATLLAFTALMPLETREPLREKLALMLRSGLRLALTMAVFLLPLMLVGKRSSDTFLYPLLGRGWHSTGVGALPKYHLLLGFFEHAQILTSSLLHDKVFLMAIGLCVLAVLQRNGAGWHERARVGLCLGAVFAGYAAFSIASTGAGTHRLCFPGVMALFLALSVDPLVIGRVARLRSARLEAFATWPAFRWRSQAALLVVGFLMVVYLFPKRDAVAAWAGAKIESRVVQSGAPAANIASMRKLQEQTRPGSTILASLDTNYLFDFRRNSILVNDQPGLAGPPPGWPRAVDGRALADYLRSGGVEYVAVYKEMPKYPFVYQWTGTLWAQMIEAAEERFMLALEQEPFRESLVWEDHVYRLFRVPGL